MKDQITVYEILGIKEPLELIEQEEWCTPREIIESARKVMGEIDLDPASSEYAQKTVRAKIFYTSEDDGLSKPWFGRVWLHPPCTPGNISAFTDKLLKSPVTEAIVLTNNNTETIWFSKLLKRSSAVVFPIGRIQFIHPMRDSTTPLQGQTIFYIGPNSGTFLKEFSKYGWGTKTSGVVVGK